jgi:arylsulfatase A-like enzyme
VLDELARLGLAESTIVVLWGDHGWHLGDHGMWCKHTNYEQATRAPLIVSAPGKKGGQHTRSLAEFVDIYPTLCDLAGIPRPAHLQGDSLVPLLDNPEAAGKPAAYQVYPRQNARTGPMLGHAVRTERWRYVEWRKADNSVAARELYDLQDNPGETANLAADAEHAAVVAEHGKLLASRLAVPAPEDLKLQDPTKPPGKPAASPQGASLPSAKRPHIILILADDMGIGDLACYGGKLAATPHIDRLAEQGTQFTQYYSAAPICSPSRAGVLTGMFPGRWRLTSFLQTRAGNRGCEQADFLDPLAPSIPRRLQRAGYATAHFGKWHLGGGRDVTDAPKLSTYGYDEHASTWESPEPHPDITSTNWIWSDLDKVKRGDRTAFFVEKTLDFLRRHKDQPCFVNLWPDDVHTPWVPGADAPKGDTKVNLRPVLVEFDQQIGRLIDGLRELGIQRETLVLFTSDNGALPTFEGARSGGLRASKLSLYEGGIRMPLIAHWPGHVPAGCVDDTTVLAAVDWFPTLAALAGAGLPDNFALDGEDMTGALLGKPVARRTPLFWEYGRNDEFFRYPQIAKDRSPNIAVREGPWKLLVNADGTRAELFDVVADPREASNLAADHPETASRLCELALAWRKSLPTQVSQAAAQPAAASQAKPQPLQRPNIVVFLTDDLSQADCGIYGAKDLPTPNMRRLASAGMTFTRAYVASPSCAPSRAALLTGLMPARNGAEANHSKPREEIKKLPAYLQELGYEVVMFGKVAHYNHGKFYGFDRTEFEGFHDHRGIEAAARFLAGRDVEKARPLCLFVGTNWPHRPWPEDAGGYDPAAVTIPSTHVDTEVTRKYRARYYHAVAKADEDLGVIYDAALQHLGKETLFIFSSDHGAQWPFGKWNCYEDGLRVPLVASWPGVIRPGTTADSMVSWIDFLPTLVEAAGGQLPESGAGPGQIEGRSFLAVLRGEKQVHREQIFGTHSGDREMNVYPIRSLREGKWKYIWNLHPEFQHTTHVDRAQAEDEVGYFRSWERAAEAGDKHAAAVIERYRRRPAFELYDLDADPLEQHNLSADPEQAKRIQALHAQLAAWMDQQGDQRTVFNKPVLLAK